MRSFLKIFLACLLAVFIFSIIIFFFLMGMAGSAVSKSMPKLTDKSVLVIDLNTKFDEVPQQDFKSIVKTQSLVETPSFYDVLQVIHKAKEDDKIKGIYIIANNNVNGFASSDEIRTALQDFKTSRKFIIAYGDAMTQKAYGVANIADKIYVSPSGGLEWHGYGVTYMFLKGTLDKLQIKPQVFYAGKYKSATEPFRFEKMSPANRLQTTVWLNDIYNDLLLKTAQARKIDTATLHHLADAGAIETSQDAANYKLIDGARYDDQVKDELKKYLKLDSTDKINFVPVEKYALTLKNTGGGSDRIALIYASGNIVDGKGEEGNIGSETYVDLLRKARFDKSVKAIVVRVNSGGGSALASDNIWREMFLAKKVKPVYVSFGDVAASGGYYMSCAADSIFAMPNTITGSIGVFGLIPDMSSFFKNKLGITFDGVQTGPLANAMSVDHPMTEQEKKLVQHEIERIYAQFKERVAQGRKKDTAYIETIAQGRVWTGLQGKQAGLVDVYGGLQNTIDAAAKAAKLTKYEIKEYPERRTFLERILGKDNDDAVAAKIKTAMGEEYYKIFEQVKKIKELSNKVQARLPFDFVIE